MGSSYEQEQEQAEVLLQKLVATLDGETLARVLQEIARGKELEVARAMIRSIHKK